MNFYRQCTLELRETQQVAWIPEQFAVLGKYLKIEDDNGWRVEEVGSLRHDESYIQDHERDFLGHRKRTDV